MSWNNFKTEFADNPCFLERMDKELKWYEGYSAYDKAGNSYKVVQFHRSCAAND